MHISTFHLSMNSRNPVLLGFCFCRLFVGFLLTTSMVYHQPTSKLSVSITAWKSSAFPPMLICCVFSVNREEGPCIALVGRLCGRKKSKCRVTLTIVAGSADWRDCYVNYFQSRVAPWSLRYNRLKKEVIDSSLTPSTFQDMATFSTRWKHRSGHQWLNYDSELCSNCSLGCAKHRPGGERVCDACCKSSQEFHDSSCKFLSCGYDQVCGVHGI